MTVIKVRLPSKVRIKRKWAASPTRVREMKSLAVSTVVTTLALVLLAMLLSWLER